MLEDPDAQNHSAMLEVMHLQGRAQKNRLTKNFSASEPSRK
jgi:hypothetical protein